MRKRPISVTIIAWLLIIAGIASPLTLITARMALNTYQDSLNAARDNPVLRDALAKTPIPAPPVLRADALVWKVESSLFSIVLGAAMLKGRNWARYLYLVRGVLGFAYTAATISGHAFIIIAMCFGLASFAVQVFFLFRRAANEYFSPRHPLSNAIVAGS